MKFPYIKLPEVFTPKLPFVREVARPIIPIVFLGVDEEFQHLCLIDSGADFCFLPAQIGERLGLDLKKGPLLESQGITGGKFKAYFHKIKLSIGGWEYETYIGFSYELGTEIGILGQNGFFDLFRVCFDRKKKEIDIRPKLKS